MNVEPMTAIEKIVKEFYHDIELDGNALPLIFEEALKNAFKEGQHSPKIKQLEWEEVWEGYEDAKTPFGHYVVRPSIDNKTFLMIDLRKGIEPYSTLSEAKAAAQEHFEKRIKECLE